LQIREVLAEQLGTAMDPYKKLIKVHQGVVVGHNQGVLTDLHTYLHCVTHTA
jgi:hypothetical protein